MMRAVRIGQRYRSAEAPSCVWEIVDIVELNGIQHAVLVLLRDGLTRKTVSATALLSRAFELVADAPDAARRRA